MRVALLLQLELANAANVTIFRQQIVMSPTIAVTLFLDPPPSSPPPPPGKLR